MQKHFLKELINKDKLQQIQEEFCQVTGVAAYCLDGEHSRVTMPSGTNDKKELLQNEMYVDRIEALLERVQEGSLEEQAVEELEEINGRIGAAAVRVEEIAVLYWVVLDLNKAGSQHFYHVLDLLRDTSMTMFSQKMDCFSAEAESWRSRYAEQEMGRSLRAVEATTGIVQLLDSDEQIELVMDKWLKILAEHIQVDTAELFQINADNSAMDVICEWCGEGMISFFDRTTQVETYHFMHTEKPLIISSDSRESEYRQELDAIGISAVILFPIITTVNGYRTVLSLNYREKRHVWNMEEIKFTADAVKILQSILTRRLQKTSLASSNAALEAVLDNVSCSIFVVDSAGANILFANQRAQSTFAKELKDGSFTEIVQHEINKEKDDGNNEIFYAQRERWYDLIYKKIAWMNGKAATLYLLYDITEKKLYQKRMEVQVYRDYLTGIYNRMCCERDLARYIDEAEKNNLRGALLYLDLDDFKHINDGLGHQYGDALLKEIAYYLQRIEGIENTCYRMGGDEFVVIIPPKHYTRFTGIVEDIKSIFCKPWFLKDADYYCTMSMGIVTYPDAGNSVTDLIKKADIAMYEAKKTGKNRVAQYSEGTDSQSGKRLDMEKNMRDAALNRYEEFEVYYQPIIDTSNNQTVCVGAEALLRWNSKKLGFISPAEFIPLAEYLGLINPIGNHVLSEACRQCKLWNDNGYPNYKVNVNLSVVQLLQADIVEIVERALQETGLKPQNLTLEVTESLAINDIERMKEILHKIKALGVDMALDDFGTGYSSLNHIRELPFDVIKVDQSFVTGLAKDAYSRSFIKMVAELAETIEMSICVEGIETDVQYEALCDMKVKYIQGHYFDRPMTKEDFQKKYAPRACQNTSKNVI